MNTKTCGDGNADNCPGCWQCQDEKDFFANCWRTYKFDVTKLLRTKGMTAIAATAAVLQLTEDACSDLNPAQCADRIIKGATQ